MIYENRVIWTISSTDLNLCVELENTFRRPYPLTTRGAARIVSKLIKTAGFSVTGDLKVIRVETLCVKGFDIDRLTANHLYDQATAGTYPVKG